MKYIVLVFAIILFAVSCKESRCEHQSEDSSIGNDVCIGDTIISSDTLISFFCIETKGKTAIKYQKNMSNDKSCGEIDALKGNHITQVTPFYTNLGIALPYYLINGYKQERDLHISVLNTYDMNVPYPVGIFPEETSCISSLPYDHNKWEIRQGRHTDKCLILIDEEEERVYVPQIGTDSIPTDRYIAYQFNGQIMMLVSENAPNPKLHKSLENYVRLRRQNDTFSTIERVDELKNGQLRLAVWAKGRKGRKVRSISEEPDVVVFGGTEIAPSLYLFEHNGTKFRINTERPIYK